MLTAIRTDNFPASSARFLRMVSPCAQSKEMILMLYVIYTMNKMNHHHHNNRGVKDVNNLRSEVNFSVKLILLSSV